jgi:RNA polymerase sigma-70 factor (ECF subfamily)
MYTIMRNIFINNYRKMGDQQYLLQIENVMQADLQHYSSVEMVEKNYDQKEIKHIIASLSPGHRAPFFLYVSGYKYHEIAERLSLPIGTVKSRIYFARQKLQSKLKDYR